MNQHNETPPYTNLAYNYVGLDVASSACAAANDYLYIGTNSYPDFVYCYDISGGSLGSLLGSWSVPWQSGTDGYDMAGMAYDDDSGQLIMVNQQSAPMAREAFDVDLTGGLVAAGYCELDNTIFPWSAALIEDGDPVPLSYFFYTVDITGFAPPFDLDEYGIPAVYPPYDLSCTVTEEWDVYLSWSNAEEYDNVHIYLDDDLIATLPGNSTEFTDLDPPTGYKHYGVSGIVGADESARAACEIVVMPDGEICFYFDETDDGWTPHG